MTTILAVSAHPDDETMAMGGTLAMYAAEGHAVYILETTRGEGGEAGEPPLTTVGQLGAFREAEVRCAAAALGAREVRFLPFVDPRMEIGGTAQRIAAPLEIFAAAIAEQLREIRPDIVFTHGRNGEYGHPQHIYTHQAVRLARRLAELPVEVWSWGAWFAGSSHERMLNRDEPADLVRDITPWFEAKLAAALCHRTQHAMFLRNTGVPEVTDMVARTESFHRWRL